MARKLTADDYVWLTREEAEKPEGGLCMHSSERDISDLVPGLVKRVE